jgi:hypothetical protein
MIMMPANTMPVSGSLSIWLRLRQQARRLQYGMQLMDAANISKRSADTVREHVPRLLLLAVLQLPMGQLHQAGSSSNELLKELGHEARKFQAREASGSQAMA